MDEAAALMRADAEEKAFEFAAGPFGFPSLKRFLVLEVPGGGQIFKQMTALDQPEIGFTLVYPFAFFPDYAPDIPDDEVRSIGAESAEQIILMAIANVPQDFKLATANLKAPVIFNPFTLQARQVILPDERYQTRERLFRA
jgi:flagellar assembly factor FliW